MKVKIIIEIGSDDYQPPKEELEAIKRLIEYDWDDYETIKFISIEVVPEESC